MTPNDLENGAFLLVPVDGPNQEALLDVLPSLDRDVFLPDGTTQSIPVMLFVTGYHDDRIVACGEAAPYCIVAPSQALLVDGESALQIQDSGASATLATLYAGKPDVAHDDPRSSLSPFYFLFDLSRARP